MLLAMRLASSSVRAFGNVSIGFCLMPINVSERLAVSIKHLEAAQAATARNLLNGPRWGEASSHCQTKCVAAYRTTEALSPAKVAKHPPALLMT
jgi:hypothetical protein